MIWGQRGYCLSTPGKESGDSCRVNSVLKIYCAALHRIMQGHAADRRGPALSSTVSAHSKRPCCCPGGRYSTVFWTASSTSSGVRRTTVLTLTVPLAPATREPQRHSHCPAVLQRRKSHHQWTTKIGIIIIAVETPPITGWALLLFFKAAVAMKPIVAAVSKNNRF